MNPRLLISPFLVLALCLCCLAACKDGRQQPARSFGAEVYDTAALHVALMANKDCLPVYVAERAGIFDTLGLKVQIAGYVSQIDCDTMLLNAVCDGGWADPVRLASFPHGGKAFTRLFSGTAEWEIFACGKLRLKNVKALKGRTVAIARDAAETAFLAAALKQEGVAREEVYLPQINSLSLRARMLTRNQMDATLLTWPYTVYALQQGNVRLPAGSLHAQKGSFVVKTASVSAADRKRKWELFRRGLEMAKDSLRTRGVAAYADVLQKDYGLPKSLADSLTFH